MRDIFVAVLAMDGKVTFECHEALIRNSHYLSNKGVSMIPFYLPYHIYVDKARNVCVKKFLETQCEDMVFVDDDIGFEKDAIWKLLEYDKDIIGGVYPFRREHKSDFPAVIDFSHNNNCKEEETGLVYANMIPTGFMRINRRVFDKFQEYYKIHSNDTYPVIKDNEEVISFFNTGILFPDDNTWYGEDVAFCTQWKKMGGELFIVPNINFTHTGYKQFSGNFHEYLLGRKIENIDKAEKGIAGWMTDNELAVLKILASQSNNIVEIGSWKGRSTKTLLEACKGTVYAVDHWKGTASDISIVGAVAIAGSQLAATQHIYDEFIKNVGHYPNLKILKGNSVDMANSFNGKKVDMIFIDAGHTYEECKLDIENWLPKCKKIMAGHDYNSNFQGVIQAVNELFGKPDCVIDSIWIKEILKEVEDVIPETEEVNTSKA